MPTARIVRQIASSLPETEDTSTPSSLSFGVRGKGFAWTWQERIEPRKPRRPRLDVLAVRCPPEEKETILSSDPEIYFTEDHYRGFPAVLVRLDKISEKELRALLAAAWRCQAPRTLANQVDAKRRDLKEAPMSTCNDVRKFALALEGVEQVDHWGRPAFRTKRRIFVTLRPSEEKAMFHIPEDRQERLFEMRPEAFEPLHWGKITRCFVNLKNVPSKEVALLVREAWEYAGTSKTRRNVEPKTTKVPPRRLTKRN